MVKELKIIEKLLFEIINSKICNLILEPESQEYYGCSFEVDEFVFKFRKGKTTPKKVGQFVTFWKRNSNNVTEPFHESDIFDFYIIAAEENENYGFFLFSKNELIEQKIVSTDCTVGKRGFRVYPPWVVAQNNQAKKSQLWQLRYFFNCSGGKLKDYEQLCSILCTKS